MTTKCEKYQLNDILYSNQVGNDCFHSKTKQIQLAEFCEEPNSDRQIVEMNAPNTTLSEQYQSIYDKFRLNRK